MLFKETYFEYKDTDKLERLKLKNANANPKDKNAVLVN